MSCLGEIYHYLAPSERQIGVEDKESNVLPLQSMPKSNVHQNSFYVKGSLLATHKENFPFSMRDSAFQCSFSKGAAVSSAYIPQKMSYFMAESLFILIWVAAVITKYKGLHKIFPNVEWLESMDKMWLIKNLCQVP